MRGWFVRGLATAGLFGATGCGLLLGIDEFTDAPRGTGGAGGSGGHGSDSTGAGASGGHGGQCAPGETLCSAGCVDTSASPDHCGACDAACERPANGTAACVNGVCAIGSCDAGRADCDGVIENGCEIDLTTDNEHCGSCDTSCFLTCSGGVCNDPIDVSAGYKHTCAILRDGSAWCWGRNADGELGDGTGVEKHVPTKISLPNAAVQISAGGGNIEGAEHGHACALLDNATVQCWGANDVHQLGLGNTNKQWSPTALVLTNVKQISAGGGHTCAVKATGELYCWGYNKYGTIGDGTAVDVPTPKLIMVDVVQVSAGQGHTCAIKTNGDVYCWGLNNTGALGTGDGANQSTPALLVGIQMDEIAAGNARTCARNQAGVFCWGLKENGGAALSPTAKNVPDATSVDVGDQHGAAVSAGTVWTWGSNLVGQLGFTPSNFQGPQATSVTSAVEVTAGGLHTCALRSNGQLLCWGGNAAGQLGDGKTTNQSTPTLVGFP